jgi:2'-5' RNA ligase
MRLFVAAELSGAVRAAAARGAGQLRERLAAAGVADGIRWVTPGNMHLTVWFRGEVSDARSAGILDALRPSLAMPAFDVHVAGFGVFPPSGAPRVLWMGVAGGREALAQAHALVGARLQPWGVQGDGRAYSAHLTVARVREQQGRARVAIRQAAAAVRCDAGSCRIEALTLFRSHTGPGGAAYAPLLRVPLE